MAEFRTYYPTNDGRLLTADDLVAENERLREALERIAHPEPDEAAFYDWSVAEKIARDALSE